MGTDDFVVISNLMEFLFDVIVVVEVSRILKFGTRPGALPQYPFVGTNPKDGIPLELDKIYLYEILQISRVCLYDLVDVAKKSATMFASFC